MSTVEFSNMNTRSCVFCSLRQKMTGGQPSRVTMTPLLMPLRVCRYFSPCIPDSLTVMLWCTPADSAQASWDQWELPSSTSAGGFEAGNFVFENNPAAAVLRSPKSLFDGMCYALFFFFFQLKILSQLRCTARVAHLMLCTNRTIQAC